MAAHPNSDGKPAQSVRWDESRLVSSKCNIAAARGAPRGVTINFGATHERDGSGHELEVELLHRVTLDPTAAARLQQLLTKLAADYEARYQQSK